MLICFKTCIYGLLSRLGRITNSKMEFVIFTLLQAPQAGWILFSQVAQERMAYTTHLVGYCFHMWLIVVHTMFVSIQSNSNLNTNKLTSLVLANHSTSAYLSHRKQLLLLHRLELFQTSTTNIYSLFKLMFQRFYRIQQNKTWYYMRSFCSKFELKYIF